MLESLRRRLTLGYVGILALILILFSAIVMGFFIRQLGREQDARLTQEASDVADYVRRQDSGESNEPPPVPSVPEESHSREDHDGHGPPEEKIGVVTFVLPPNDSSNATDADVYGRIPSPDSPNVDLGLPSKEAAREAERDEEPRFGPKGGKGRPKKARTIEAEEADVRVVSLPVKSETGETIAVVQAAQSRWAVRERAGDLLSILIPVGLGSLIFAGVGGLFMSRRAMRPVSESFRRQRTFIANASHELKTPLALVKIHAEVIGRNPTDPENEAFVEDQLSEIDRMNALLSDLLILARLDAGRLEVEDKPFDLSVVAAETAGRFLVRAAAEDIHLEVEMPETLSARGDPERTAQVMTALLDNALRHTPTGGAVTVSGGLSGDRAEATVTDTGPGVAPEQLERIFDRFYRAEEARTRSGGGTGLGLSIARDLTRAQRGDLHAANAPEGGAAFRLSLPAG